MADRKGVCVCVCVEKQVARTFTNKEDKKEALKNKHQDVNAELALPWPSAVSNALRS